MAKKEPAVDVGTRGQRLVRLADASSHCRLYWRELSAEADHWLLLECHCGQHIHEARDIRASIISGEPPSDEGRAWLKRVGEGTAAGAEWARCIAAWW